MTREQISTLNSLVTFAIETLDGIGRRGVRDDEREVAKIVGTWCLSRQGPLIVEPDMRIVLGGEMGHALTESGNAVAGYSSACSCGWDSGPRPNTHRAYADWLGHVAEQIPGGVKRYIAGRGVWR